MINENNILIIADAWEYIQFYLKDKMNLKIVLFQSPDRKHRDRKELCEEIHYLDLKNKEKATKLAIELNKKYNFKAVCSFTDEGVELSSRISQELKLHHNPENVSILVNNKNYLREFLYEHNFENIKHSLILNAKDLLSFSNLNGFPIIIKPSDGSASRDVVKINNNEELEKYIETNEFGKNKLLVEEYLDGPEFSVETISFNGIHEIIQITSKRLFPNSNVEMEHLMPANVSYKEREDINNYILELLNLIGQKTGPCHIEIKLTSNGPKLIEAHTRPGGDFIVLLLADVFGVDVICETVNYLMDGSIPNRIKTDSKCGLVRYFYDKPGKILGIKGFNEVIKHPKVINSELCFEVGDYVPKLQSSFTRHGCLIIEDTSVESASNLANKLVKKISFDIL